MDKHLLKNINSENGNMKYEINRILSFKNYPKYNSSYVMSLADQGCFYDQITKKVMCFFCELSLGRIEKYGHLNKRNCSYRKASSNIPIFAPTKSSEHYKYFFNKYNRDKDVTDETGLNSVQETTNDLMVTESRSFQPHEACCMLEHTNTRPITVLRNQGKQDMKVERNRLDTFVKWPSVIPISPTDLVKNGFYYLGYSDRVKCAFCNGELLNWSEDDSVEEQHKEYFPSCPFILGEAVGNVPPSEPYLETNPQNNLFLSIMLERPKHPQYALLADRLRTFKSWPSNKVQTPALMAEAGFFHKGENDTAICYNCDGGLKNWEPEDDPWEEHGRWYPRCSYVRQKKGDEFINALRQDSRFSLFSMPPQLLQPQLNVSDDDALQNDTTAERADQPIDVREIRARLDTPAVQAVLQMGASRKLVQKVIEKQLQSTGKDFSSAQTLLDAVFEEEHMEEETTTTENKMVSNTQTVQKREMSGINNAADLSAVNREKTSSLVLPPPDSLSKTSATDTKSLMEENQNLKDQRICKICLDKEVNVVFLPCGHLLCCANCAVALMFCPVCRAQIEGTVRTYMS